jgi:hypothetical protein
VFDVLQKSTTKNNTRLIPNETSPCEHGWEGAFVICVEWVAGNILDEKVCLSVERSRVVLNKCEHGSSSPPCNEFDAVLVF